MKEQKDKRKIKEKYDKKELEELGIFLKEHEYETHEKNEGKKE